MSDQCEGTNLNSAPYRLNGKHRFGCPHVSDPYGTHLLWQRAVKLGTVILHIVPNIKYYYGLALQQEVGHIELKLEGRYI